MVQELFPHEGIWGFLGNALAEDAKFGWETEAFAS